MALNMAPSFPPQCESQGPKSEKCVVWTGDHSLSSRGDSGQKGCQSSLVWSLGTGLVSVCINVFTAGGGVTSMCSVLREGWCRWTKQWREGGRPLPGRCRWCNRWRGVSERRWSKLSLAAAAFCRRFSSVVPVQFYRLWEFIVQLHLCFLERQQKKEKIKSEREKM